MTKHISGLLYSALMAVLVLAATSCNKGQVIYEQNKNIAQQGWYIDSVATFAFDIQDTAARYDISYNVRNQLVYPYYNLYVTFYLYDPQGKLIASSLHEMTLADPATGKPFGDGFGDVRDHQFLSLPRCHFKQAGRYTFKIKQYMRQNPLQGIEAIGLKVAVAEPNASKN